MNTITATGKVRDWTGPKENYMKHHEIIEWWCEGGEVEAESNGAWWVVAELEVLHAYADTQYRRKHREPKSGEVWIGKEGKDACLITNTGYVWLDSCDSYERPLLDQWPTGMICTAPSVQSFYARKFYESSMTKDAGFDYEDARKCMNVLKEACRYDD